MATLLSIIVFLFGLAVGSFLNCVVDRLETGQSFLSGRSFCPKCQRPLGFWDLIPVLSFVSLRGKCRYCQKKIAWQHPLAEISTGVLFVLIYNISMSEIPRMSDILFFLFYFIVASFLIVIFVYDLKHYIIPDKIIYPAIGITLIYNVLMFDIPRMSNILISAFGAAGFFLAIVLLSRGKWMGAGDIKLGFLMGLLLGWPDVYLALFLAFMTGAVIGLTLIFLGRKSLKSEVPFGPFLVGGTFAALFWGQQIINWYLSLL